MTSCGNPSVEDNAIMPRRLKYDRNKTCVKCKSTGSIVIRHIVYCKSCFFPLVITKFRRSLHPSINEKSDTPRQKSLKAPGNLLIAISGGLGSTVLLDLVAYNYFTKSPLKGTKGGKEHPRNRERVWAKAAVCYVETCGAFPEMADRTVDVQDAVSPYEAFDFIPLRIEDAFDPIWWQKVCGIASSSSPQIDMDTGDLSISFIQNSPGSDPITRLRSYLASMPTQTALHASIQVLTRMLLLYTAKSTHSSHLLLGTSLTSLSISLISSIAQGGGFAVREEVQEVWNAMDHHKDIRVVRPLLDIGMKECAAWAWWKELKVVGKQTIPQAKQGIGTLTKDFIIGLERDYPSTVSTISRTCLKLAPKDDARGPCVLCQRPAQMGVQAWKSSISIRSYSDHGRPPPHHPGDSLSTVDATSRPSLTPMLCYSCHTTLTSKSSRGSHKTNQPRGRSDGTSTNASLVPLPVWAESLLGDPRLLAENTGSYGMDGRTAVDQEVWEPRKLDIADMEKAIGDFVLND